jgi:hypothetical protein
MGISAVLEPQDPPEPGEGDGLRATRGEERHTRDGGQTPQPVATEKDDGHVFEIGVPGMAERPPDHERGCEGKAAQLPPHTAVRTQDRSTDAGAEPLRTRSGRAVAPPMRCTLPEEPRVFRNDPSAT